MKITTRLLSIITILALLAACAPAPTAMPLATLTPAPTATITPSPTITATQRPSASLKEAATLYSGPDLTGYEVIAEIPVDAQIFPLGIFGDFIKADVQNDGKTLSGYLRRDDLQNIPSGVAELSLKDIPWQSTYVMNAFYGWKTTINGNQVTVDNTTDGYIDPMGSGIILDSPFKFTAKLTPENTDYGSVKFMGGPHPTEGDWWKGIHRLDVMAQKGKLLLGIRDGTTEGYIKSYTLNLSVTQLFTIIFHDAQGKTLSVLDGSGKEILQVNVASLPGVNLPNGLFAEKQLYLGLSSAPHSTLVVSSILFEKAPTGKIQLTDQTFPGLKELASKHNITIGTEYTLYDVRDSRFYTILNRDFNVLSIGDFTYQGWIGPDEYDFSWVDQEVEFAVQNGFTVRAMHLVWGTSKAENVIPDWLYTGKFTRDEYIQILKNHIQTIVTRYKGKITEWSIANEAIQRSYYSGSDFWNDKIGPDYIEMSFRWAHEIDPDAILIFNGDENASPLDALTKLNVEKTYQTVKALKAKGVPIDVVGMQMHLFLPWNSQIAPQKDDVIATMRRFGELDVKIYITELDINLHNISGTQDEKWKYQANLYKEMMEACIESGVCTSFSTWGVTDGNSWITCNWPGCVKIPDADPLMFDKDYNPKPAYFAVQEALKDK